MLGFLGGQQGSRPHLPAAEGGRALLSEAGKRRDAVDGLAVRQIQCHEASEAAPRLQGKKNRGFRACLFVGSSERYHQRF